MWIRPVRRPTVLVAALLGGAVLGSMLVAGSAASLPVTSLSLTPYRSCVLTATPTTTTAVADTEVRQATATTNYGTLTSMTITSSGTANRRAYMRFDLTQCVPAIPSTASVRLATLRLYVTTLPAVCRTILLFRSTATWGETTITWNNQPFGTALNNPANGSATGAFDVGTPVGCQNRTTATYIVGGTVTTDVASWVAGGSTNFGWMLRDSAEGSATARTVVFSSKNLGTITQVPQLIVTYVNVP